MKKYLFMAIAAIVCIACGDNNGATPSSDKKALNAATVQAVDLVGADAATVDKSFTNAGFVKAEVQTQANAPKQFAKKNLAKIVAEEEATEVAYVYNLPKNFETMSDEEAEKYMMDMFKNGKGIVIVYVSFVDGKAYTYSVSCLLAWNEKVNTVYCETSDNLYKKLPAADKALRIQWFGQVSGSNKQYTEHADFVADILASDGIEAKEGALAITSQEGDGIYYGGSWKTPNAEDRAEMDKAGQPSFVIAAFAVASPLAVLQ